MRPRGHPRMRWMDCVRWSMKMLNLTTENAMDKLADPESCGTNARMIMMMYSMNSFLRKGIFIFLLYYYSLIIFLFTFCNKFTQIFNIFQDYPRKNFEIFSLYYFRTNYFHRKQNGIVFNVMEWNLVQAYHFCFHVKAWLNTIWVKVILNMHVKN